MSNIFSWLQMHITENAVLPSFFFMMRMLMIKCLCIAFYFNLLYFIICYIRKFKVIKTHIQVNYYCWYLLLFSFVFANLEVNNYFISFVCKEIYSGKHAPYINLLDYLLSTLWLFIFVYKMIINFLSNYKIQKYLKNMLFFEDSKDYVIRAKMALGLNKKVKFVITDYINSPVSYGVLNKYVLIPSNYEEKYTSDELYLMIVHELSHIKNGDTIKLHFINLIECLMWFNPIVYIFYRKFRNDTEILCDNQVLGTQYIERQIYGDLLLKGCSSRNTTIGYNFSDSYHIIKNRIEALYNYKPIKHSFNSIATLSVIIFMVMCSIIHFTYSDNININDDYNSIFEINLCISNSIICNPVDSRFYNEIYEVKDNTIFINKSALRELADKNSTYDAITIGSKNFTYSTSQFVFTNGNNYRFSFDEIFSDVENQYFSFSLSKRHPIEYLFLQIINKI